MENWNEPARKWQKPVVISIENAGRQTVEGPYAAAMILQTIWPIAGGKCHDEAVVMCVAAAERQMPAGKAREAFLAAVQEAGLALISQEESLDAAPQRPRRDTPPQAPVEEQIRR